jgi:epoxide hydrolase-like predicted phosphatase
MKKNRTEMNHYKAIVFDLGNVLIPFDYLRLLNKLDEIDKGLGKRFAERYKNNYDVHRSFEKSEITEEEFLRIMIQWTEGKLNTEQFKIYYSDLFEENSKVTSLLPILKENYKLVLLSNTNAIHKKYGWEKYGFLKYFDKMVLSHEVRAVKPEEKIYRAVENFTGFKPNEHLYIDDIEEYTAKAKILGWDVIRFIDAEQLKEELRKRNVL